MLRNLVEKALALRLAVIGLALILAGVTLPGVPPAATRQRVADAITLPLSVLLFTAIAARALWWKARYGGVLWKGRVLHVS